MNISKDTEHVLEFLDYATGNNLRKRNDIASILEISATYGESELMNDLILNASSLWNIHMTLKRQINSEISLENLHIEKNIALDNLKKILQELIGDELKESKEFNERFKKIYFQETQGADSNLIDLAHDINELNNIRKTIKSSKFQK